MRCLVMSGLERIVHVIDLSTTRLVLGQGVIGSYLIERFDQENVEYVVMDVGEGIAELPQFTLTTSNINSNLGVFRNSFLSKKAMVWGRGLMKIPEHEYSESKHPITSETFKESIENACEFFLNRDSSLFQPYKIGDDTFIDSLIIPKKRHDEFFFRRSKSLIEGYMAIEIIPENVGFTVRSINLKTGSELKVFTRELFITLGCVETVRLLLNSKALFGGEQTEIGQNWTDHVSCETASIFLAKGDQLQHISPRKEDIRVYPRFYHDPQNSGGFFGRGGFSFLDFNPFAPPSSFKKRLQRKISKYELATGHAVSKILLETDRSEDSYMELSGKTNGKIPRIHLNLNISGKFIESLNDNTRNFLDYLRSKDVELTESLLSGESFSNRLFDSLHPTGVLPVSSSPKVGAFDSNFEMHGNPGLFCFSTGLLPRAFSVQPTLSGVAFADMYLTRLFGKKRSSESEA